MMNLLQRRHAVLGAKKDMVAAAVPHPVSAVHSYTASPLATAPQRHSLRCRATATLEARNSAPTAASSSFMSLMEEDEEGEYEDDEDPERIEVEADESLKISNLGLCAETEAALAKKGILALFAIQKAVFKPAVEGRDMIGRAKTGSGKTLAFALPVVESLLEENRQRAPKRGRTPRCIILAPTRELANQVAREFESICPGSLVVASFYGGVASGPQMRSLMQGVDVAVGTPGRIMDLIDRRCLILDQVRYAIMDEADSMLDMGFEEDMERILKNVPPQRQTMLFSATLPAWINKVARKYLKNPLLVDLVGEANTGKLAETIRLMILQVEQSQKLKALLDVLSVYSAGGGAIVFVNTKRMADELQSRIRETAPCEVLHGDVPQSQRELALKDFRAGKFSVLVATDVAARGLDIQNVDLVVHYDLPQDNEAFLHRSGRTGRAGNKGTAVILYTDRDTRSLSQLFKETKVIDVELVGSPDPADVMTTSARTVLTKLDKVDNQVIDFFVPAAERLLASEQPSRVLAAALASMSGFRFVPKPRSLLTYEEGHVTLRLAAGPGAVDSWLALSRTLGVLVAKAGIKVDLEQQIGKIKVLGKGADGRESTAFDLPISAATKLMTCAPLAESMGMVLDRPKALLVNAQELLGGGGRSSSYSSRDSPRGMRSGGRSSSGSYGGSERSSSRGSSSGGYGSDRGGGGGGYSSDRGSDRGGGYSNDRSSSRGGGGSSGYGASTGGASSRGGGGGGYSNGGGGGGYSNGGGGGGYERSAPAGGRQTESWGSAPAAPARTYAPAAPAAAPRGRVAAKYDDDISDWDSASGWDAPAPAPRTRR